MKQFLFTALFCASAVFSFAQSGIIVTNYSNCDVYVRLRADQFAGGCPSNYVSNVFKMIPGDVISFSDPSVVTGGMFNGGTPLTTPGGWFGEVEFIECDPAAGCAGTCSSTFTLIDYCALASPYAHNTYDAACTFCNTVTINASSTATDHIVDVF